MISYYELLGMIKEGKEPNKLRFHQVGTSKTYVREDDIDGSCWYVLENDCDCDDNFRTYLSDCLLECDMFDEKIEILDGEVIKLPLLVNPNSNELEINDTLVKIVDKIKKIESMLER